MAHKTTTLCATDLIAALVFPKERNFSVVKTPPNKTLETHLEFVQREAN